MSDTVNLQNYLAKYTENLLKQTATAIEDLNLEELHYRPDGPCNSIAFDAWHIIRTADNLI
ncbi:MAG: DinB family protein, partial [Dehalococcoidia bacterium]|nr:DinB family protein [Dehalococcoidia bacterium]